MPPVTQCSLGEEILFPSFSHVRSKYPQLNSPIDNNLSILKLLFICIKASDFLICRSNIRAAGQYLLDARASGCLY